MSAAEKPLSAKPPTKDVGLRMSSEEFDVARQKFRRLSSETVDIARSIMVDGLSRSKAAEKFLTTPARVHQIMQRVTAALAEVPRGWVLVQVHLPPEMALSMLQLADEVRAAYKPPRLGRPRAMSES